MIDGTVHISHVRDTPKETAVAWLSLQSGWKFDLTRNHGQDDPEIFAWMSVWKPMSARDNQSSPGLISMIMVDPVSGVSYKEIATIPLTREEVLPLNNFVGFAACWDDELSTILFGEPYPEFRYE